jgi:PIN domain-containing protein
VRLLLDTHALLWWLADEGLHPSAQDAIADPANLVVVSAASAWEISIKKALGKLAAPDDLERQVQAGGFVPLPIGLASRRSLRPHADSAGTGGRADDRDARQAFRRLRRGGPASLTTNDHGSPAPGTLIMAAPPRGT